MSDKLIKVASFNTPVEANYAQNLLAEEGGIESCLDNEMTAGLFGYLNVALGGVKLFVYDFDAERAREILARGLPDSSPEEIRARTAFPGGKCSKCNVKLEPGFEVCWSCGEVLEALPVPAEAEELVLQSIPVKKCPKCDAELEPGFAVCWSCGESFDAPFLDSVEDADDSTTSPTPEKNSQTKPETSLQTIIEEADDLAKKAWFASILGFFVCPGILHVYSAWLILILLANRFPISRTGYRRLLLAIFVDLAVFAFLGWFVWQNYF